MIQTDVLDTEHNLSLLTIEMFFFSLCIWFRTRKSKDYLTVKSIMDPIVKQLLTNMNNRI